LRSILCCSILFSVIGGCSSKAFQGIKKIEVTNIYIFQLILERKKKEIKEKKKKKNKKKKNKSKKKKKKGNIKKKKIFLKLFKKILIKVIIIVSFLNFF